MANRIEEAKSGQASCRTCKNKIAKGELRLGVEAANAFGDTPSMQWHHLACAAGKLPVELADAMKAYVGDIPDRAALEAAMADAIKSGKAKPGGFPYADKAPTGRAKCMQCGEAIAKDSFRIAVERELEMGGGQQKSAGYLHPACIAANLEEVGGTIDDFTASLEHNSRIPKEDLDKVIMSVRTAS